MKKREKSPPGKSRQYRKHPIGQRLLVGLLCVCLSLVSLPLENYGYLALAAQKQEIIMFSSLPEEVRIQSVSSGTDLKGLKLPEELTAVCRVAEESSGEVNLEALEVNAQALPQASLPPAEAEEPDEKVKIGEAENLPSGEELPSETVEPEEKTEAGEPADTDVPGEAEVPADTEPAAEPQAPADAVETETEQNRTETVTIEGITWTSEPEYDKETEGFYTFTPVIPDNYSLTAGVGLPAITVTVYKSSGKAETKEQAREEKPKAKEVKTGKAREGETELVVLAEDSEPPSTPSCGRITQDTVWKERGTLNTGELIVEPGVTLTIHNVLSINGTVTIKGGGTIVRGSKDACFVAEKESELILEDITLEGNSIPADAMLLVGAKLVMNAGSRIQNCVSTSFGGAISSMGATIILNGAEIINCSAANSAGAIYLSGGSLTIEYAVIDKCSASTLGGAIYQNGRAKVIIKDGRFSNNKTTEKSAYWSGGGFLCLCSSTLEIYGGEFINNTSVSHGGCIHHCGCEGTQTEIQGGYFAGNTCTLEGYEGSGAIYYSTKYTGTSNSITLSGKVRFCGDDDQRSGTDGIYLDTKNESNLLRKIQISDTLSYPVNLYVAATEGRVIAKGVHAYRLLRERDMKKINFIDVGDSGKTWYAVLDEKENEVLISEVNPNYGYYVYYISDHTQETVVDDNRYEDGDTVTVQSAENLSIEGSTFMEWNTKADGTGTSYRPGETFTIHNDTDLFAIFQEDKKLSANFYSGSAGQKEIITVMAAADVENGTVKAPQIQEMEGWTPLGWNAMKDQYTGDFLPEDDVRAAEEGNAEYYGIYQKDVFLSYEAKQADIVPEQSVGYNYANVHEEISTIPAQFTVAPAAVRYGYAFAGWNTKKDGTGETYREGDILETETDMTLYAVFKKPLHAYFYSGSAGEKEEKIVDIPEDAISGKMNTPELKALKRSPEADGKSNLTGEGWTAVGWDLEQESYSGEIHEGEEVILTDDTNYYGVYKKNAVLTYVAKGVEGYPKETHGECRANVHEELLVRPAEFSIAAGAVRPGTAFTGWNTEPDGSGIMYQEGDICRTEEDITLYAMFQKTLSATFYSGSEGKTDVRSASVAGDATTGTVQAPELQEMEGWQRVGWDRECHGYTGGIQAGSELTLTADTEYYGVYEKDVTLSYEGEAGAEAGETKACQANVHKDEITYNPAKFILMKEPEREGYTFQGWNTEAKGSGKSYPAGSEQDFEEDTILYAIWEADKVPYRVEHYQQEISGDQYVRIETEELVGLTDSTVEAQAKKYPGFTENKSHTLSRSLGTVKADGSLILRFFYDRNIYEVDFDLNGGEGEEPDPQSVRYGMLLETVELPHRTGYNFKGWYLDRAGTQGSQWDFARTVEENTVFESVTLYAKWVDEIAPVLGEASYEEGHKDVLNWILRRKSLKITVPITEEGSGVRKAEYVLTPEKAIKEKKTAQLKSEHVLIYGNIGMPLLAVKAGGRISGPVKGKARVRTRNGKTMAEFTVAEDFKGSITMTSSDRAGNISAEKILTAEGGGIIVEDNAPDIQLAMNSPGQSANAVAVNAKVQDNVNGNVSGGIAGISYQVDEGEAVRLPEKLFRNKLVESYDFTVEIRGAGSHTLKVEAIDNAGYKNSREIQVEIRGEHTIPPGQEPKTGDNSHVEIYATISMIAGFSYLLLYFREHGMTEQKKQELVSRLVKWAKGKGSVQRMFALAIIFLLLAYYHSVGRSVSGDWREVYEK
ncbi:hypothetical protein D3Z36_01605 [Lachnospiraceae bacterium]|nr:hypothetical protein [Lachnospiraceae bacterium]